MAEQEWSVTVSRNGEQVVTIEKAMLSGRDIDPSDEEAIRTAAYHLLAFIGDAPLPEPRNEANDFAALGMEMPGVTS